MRHGRRRTINLRAWYSPSYHPGREYFKNYFTVQIKDYFLCEMTLYSCSLKYKRHIPIAIILGTISWVESINHVTKIKSILMDTEYFQTSSEMVIEGRLRGLDFYVHSTFCALLFGKNQPLECAKVHLSEQGACETLIKTWVQGWRPQQTWLTNPLQPSDVYHLTNLMNIPYSAE